MGASQYCNFYCNFSILEIRTPYIQTVYQNFISGNLLIYKLVHTFGGNKYLK